MRRIGGVFAVAACVAGLAAGQSSGAPTEILVDDLRDNCPEAEFISVQAAVDAAVARGIKNVVVCRGIYLESVTIPAAAANLKLRGPGEPANPLTSCTADRLPDPTKDAVITGTGAYGISVEAQGATVQGLTVTAVQTGAGIRTSGTAAGYTLRYNLVADNMRGLELRSSGTARLLAEYNCLIANNRGSENGTEDDPSGYGIWSPKLANAVVQKNVFRAHASRAIDLSQVKALVIKLNKLFGDGSVEFHGGTSVFLQQNRINDANGRTAILLDGVKDFLVERNKVLDGGGGGIAVLPKGGNAFTANWLRYNTVKRVAGDGIRVVAPGASKNNQLVQNRVFDAGGDGLSVESEAVEGATGVLVQENHAERSALHDCHDAGGPNTWTGNVGETQNVPGLCPGGEVTPGP